MRIDKELIERCNKNEIMIDDFLILYNIYFNCNWELNVFPAKINRLKNLGLLESEEKVTYQGEVLIFDILPKNEPTNPPSEKIEKFEELWKLFPTNDGWGRFPSTRTIRTQKVLTKNFYIEALQDMPHEKLMEALAKEVEFRKTSSSENKLKYMKSSYNWLKEKCYLDMIDVDEDYEENRAEVL